MGDERKEIGEGAGQSDAAASGRPGAGENEEAEVTRREFMRRAAMVSGLAGFGLLGADALLEVVLKRMQAMESTRRLAHGIAREATDLGLLTNARADEAGIEGDWSCTPYSLHCTANNPWVCVPDGFKFICGPGQGTPNGFWCDDFSAFQVYDPDCTPAVPIDCGESGAADFTCQVRYRCGLAGDPEGFLCGYEGQPAGDPDFVCTPSSEGNFDCMVNFQCLCQFWCLDNSNNGCNDSKFGCSASAFCASAQSHHCYISYNCGTWSQYDGVYVC